MSPAAPPNARAAIPYHCDPGTIPSRRGVSEATSIVALTARLRGRDAAGAHCSFSVVYPEPACVHTLVEEVAARIPDAPAVTFGTDTLTFAQLNARANQLAHRLRRSGVGPDVLVGVCLERSIDMAVAVLGVLKAGGAYVPLDPDYPADRLAFMVSDTAAPVVLAQPSTRGRLPASAATIVDMEEERAALTLEPDTNPGVDVDPENLLYVIYTSGSTGRPKGTALSHRALGNLIRWHLQTLARSGRAHGRLGLEQPARAAHLGADACQELGPGGHRGPSRSSSAQRSWKVRMAIGGNVTVDNIHAGGIAAAVDIEAGTLGPASNLGDDAALGWLDCHPDTGGKILGRTLPLWADVLKLARWAHCAFADRVVIGWDIAILVEGPTLVEGNSGPDVDLMQRPLRRGIGQGRFAELLLYNLRGGQAAPAQANSNRYPLRSPPGAGSDIGHR